MDEELYSALMYNPRLAAQGERRRQRNAEVGNPSDIAEIAAGFHPVLGPAISAKDFKDSYEKDDKLGMGLSALGMLPVAGGIVKPAAKAFASYAPFEKMSDVIGMFRTKRGSTYAHHPDATTTRNRSGANHTDTSEGLQQRSGKTVFLDPSSVNFVGGYFQNPDMATRVVPVLDKSGKPTGKLAVELLEDYGPRKAGEILYEAPYSTTPKVGMSPVEVYGSESRIGDAGRNIHFGNEIVEIMPSAQNKAAGGEVKISEDTLFDPKGSGYDYKTARAYGMGSGDDGHWGSVVPASRQERELYNLPEGSYVMLKGAQHPTWQKAVDAEQDRGSKIVKHGDRYYSVPQEIKKAKGGAIKMPDNYSNGSWKLI